MKKIVGLILSLMMILALLPALPAKADDPYIKVGDTKINTAVSASYMDGKVEYDASTHTLTLNDLDLTYNGIVIYATGLDFDLTIKGSAKLTSEYQSVISPHANLILDGDFEFYSAYQDTVFLSEWSLTIDGGSLYAKREGGGYALLAKELILNNGETFVLGNEGASEIQIEVVDYTVGVSVSPDGAGTVTGGGTYHNRSTATVKAEAKEDYEFVNWTEDGTEASTKASYSFTVEKKRSLVANFAAKKYDLTFDLNGGTLDGKTGIITMTYEYGSEINLPDAPTKEGYTFKYWKGSTHAAGEKYTVTEKHDFTAEWGETIDSVSLTVTPPLCGTSVFGNSWSDFYVGDTRQTPQPEVSIPSGEGYELDEDEYTNYGIWLTSDYYWVKGTIIGGKTYIAEISLRPTEDFAFADEMSISVSGGTLKDYSVYWNDDGQDLMVFVEVEALHDWGEWTVTKEPTTTEEGVETRVCKYDPTHTETRPIPKLPDDNPKTGDNGDAGLWAAIMGGSLLAVIALITAGRKYRKKQR